MDYEIEIHSIKLHLLPERAVYIPSEKMLLIADWHLGKTAHFRKHGIFVTKTSFAKEFAQLETILNRLVVEKVVFLGDLFHSQFNMDWIQFQHALKNYPHIYFILTKGNHDILSNEIYENSILEVVNKFIIQDKFILTHEPLKRPSEQQLNLFGHIHPGVKIVTKSREVFHLPAFIWNKNQFIIPAFGKHTGLHLMKPNSESRCFVILGDEIRELKK